MNRPRAVVWSLSGLLAGVVGWLSGALLLGSNMGRTVLAATATAAVLGLLARRPRLAAVAALATAAAASLAFLVGRTAVTPLIAWPVAGLVIGLSSLALLQRARARLVIVVAAPLLGSLGFVLGMVAIVFAGMATNDGLLLGQFLWGGAAGFGLLTIAAIRALGARLDTVSASAGGAS
jgi:hypothetical protein